MAKINWANSDIVKAQDMNDIGEEINGLRTDIDNIHIPDASTTQKGIVQLTNETMSRSESLVPTARALAEVLDFATNTTDDLYSALSGVQSTASAANTAATNAQSAADTANNSIGPLSSLLTSAKGNTVAAINEVFQSGVDAKNQIVGAANSKLGAGASTSDPWGTIANKITNAKVVRSVFGFGSSVDWGLQITTGIAFANYPPSYDRIEMELGSGTNTKDCYLYTLAPIDLTSVPYLWYLGVQQINRGSDIARVVVDPVQHGSYSGGTIVASSDIPYHGSGYRQEVSIYTQGLTGWYYLRVHARGTSGKLWLEKMLLQ
ncbi:phage tail protein [Paenibacillus macerans]|uniref:phage tail protein n=1 Tax=Paenibacillus macerans TaxID=44252 RepID=UPI0020423890|nr:phage tail protein [Paenibacillus macerans]MCM3701416.1 phage tail protein [Paenibacillus macerans]